MDMATGAKCGATPPISGTTLLDSASGVTCGVNLEPALGLEPRTCWLRISSMSA